MKRLQNLFVKNKAGTSAELLSSDDPPNQSGNERVARTSRAVSKTEHPTGFETLSPGKDSELIVADIVFVHGLRGHRTNTWTKDGICWPKEILAKEKDLPNVRILAYGYDANVITPFEPSSLNNLYQHSFGLVNDLLGERKKQHERPIIFVAHSLGGILVKSALDYSGDYKKMNQKDPRGSILQATRGIIFLGTPHNGCDMAELGTLLSYFAKLGGRPINDDLIKGLTKKSEVLERIRDKFGFIWEERRESKDLAIWSFGEELPLPLIGKQVVDNNSYTIGDPREMRNTIRADHMGMTKYSSRTDPGYVKVFNAIDEMVDNLKTAPKSVPGALEWLKPESNSSEPPRASDISGQYNGVSMKANEIYQFHLKRHQRGFPLWIPSPGSSQAAGVCIGDVGLFTPEGGFEYLFNVCNSREHPMNSAGVPKNFNPIPLKESDRRQFSEFHGESYLASSSVTKLASVQDSSGFLFASCAANGAILTMPDGAYGEKLREYPVVMNGYTNLAQANAEDWYRFVNNELQWGIANGDLRLVIGYEKTTTWGMAAFTNTDQTDLQFTFYPQSPTSSPRWGHSASGPAGIITAKKGSDVYELGAVASQRGNQCLFINAMSVQLSEDNWERIRLLLAVQNDSEHSVSSTTALSGTDFNSSGVSFATGSTSASSTNDANNNEGSRKKSEATGTSAGLNKENNNNQTQGAIVTIEFPVRAMIHPSNIVNSFLLKEKPGARIAISHDRDWYSVVSDQDEIFPEPTELLKRICLVKEVCEDNGVVYLTLRGRDQATKMQEDNRVALVVQDFKSHQQTLPRYLFGESYISIEDRAAHLSKLVHTLKTIKYGSSLGPELFDCLSSILVLHPERLLSLKDIANLPGNSLPDVGEEFIPYLFSAALHSRMRSHPAAPRDTGNILIRLGNALARRYYRLKQIDDLEEAIQSFRDAHECLSMDEDYNLEALLGLTRSICQRYLMKRSHPDLEYLVTLLERQNCLDFDRILRPLSDHLDSLDDQLLSEDLKDEVPLRRSWISIPTISFSEHLRNFVAKNKPATSSGLLSSDDPLNQLGNEPVAGTSRAMSENSRPIGCETLYAGEEPIIADIVFVHGLRGHRKNTWTKDDICWPEQLLPKEKGLSNVRILAFGYDANIITSFGPASLNNLFKHSINLVNALWRERKTEADRPIIFVAHSLGGLLVKDALRYSCDYGSDDHRNSIFSATHGIIFLGTPHRGSNMAELANFILFLAKLGGKKINRDSIQDLRSESEVLDRIRDDFSRICGKRNVVIWSFEEELALSTGKVVYGDSATIGDRGEFHDTIHADHITMTKYSTTADDGYRKVLNALEDMLEKLNKQQCYRREGT